MRALVAALVFCAVPAVAGLSGPVEPAPKAELRVAAPQAALAPLAAVAAPHPNLVAVSPVELAAASRAPAPACALPQASVLAGPRAALAAKIFDGAVARVSGGYDAVTDLRKGPAGFAGLARSAGRWSTETQVGRLAQTPRAADESFRFAVIGDAEPGEFWFIRLFNRWGVFPQLLSRASARGVDFVAQLGDFVSRGTFSRFADAFGLLDRVLPPPFLTIPGNHDRSSPRAARPGNLNLYRDLFGSQDHVLDRGGVRFVFLDTSARRLTDSQLRWLDAALDVPGRKIVFTHVPPGPLKRWADYKGKKLVGGFGPGAREFTEIVSRRGVDRVYLGHVHGFDVLEHKGVKYVLSGGGGSPLFPSGARSRFHHFIEVDVTAEGLTEYVHHVDGSIYRLVW